MYPIEGEEDDSSRKGDVAWSEEIDDAGEMRLRDFAAATRRNRSWYQWHAFYHCGSFAVDAFEHATGRPFVCKGYNNPDVLGGCISGCNSGNCLSTQGDLPGDRGLY